MNIFSTFIILVDDTSRCCRELVVSSSGPGSIKQYSTMGNYQYFGQNANGDNVYQHSDVTDRFLHCYHLATNFQNSHWIVIEFNLTYISNQVKRQER